MKTVEYTCGHKRELDIASIVSGICLKCHQGVLKKSITTESDPSGKDAHEPGAKLDAGKTRMSLVLGGFSLALTEVGKVGTYGANKYTDNGWMSVENGEARYSDAMLRHYFSEAAGEQCDKDTNLRHAAHAAWNALARLELMLREERQDDAA